MELTRKMQMLTGFLLLLSLVMDASSSSAAAAAESFGRQVTISETVEASGPWMRKKTLDHLPWEFGAAESMGCWMLRNFTVYNTSLTPCSTSNMVKTTLSMSTNTSRNNVKLSARHSRRLKVQVPVNERPFHHYFVLVWAAVLLSTGLVIWGVGVAPARDEQQSQQISSSDSTPEPAGSTFRKLYMYGAISSALALLIFFIHFCYRNGKKKGF